LDIKILCRLGGLRALSGRGPRELASEVAVPEREEEAVGAVEMTIVGLISGISSKNICFKSVIYLLTYLHFRCKFCD